MVFRLGTFFKDHINCEDDQLAMDIHLNNDKSAFCFDKPIETIPAEVYITNQRPDIVICNKVKKTIKLIEVTVPHESNIANAQTRKASRYDGLIAGLDECGYDCTFHSVEFGSRGVIPHGTLKKLCNICGARKSEVKAFLTNMSKLVLSCSYVIFKERNNENAILSSVLN